MRRKSQATSKLAYYNAAVVLLIVFVGLIPTKVLSQNVGIGTNTPVQKLTIASSLINGAGNTDVLGFYAANPLVAFASANGTAVAYIKGVTNTAVTPQYPVQGLEIGAVPGRNIYLSTNYGPRLTVTDYGKVGIGTITPGQWLTLRSTTVESADNTYLLGFEGRNPVITFANINGVGGGYIKSWTDAPNLGFSTGIILGATPGQNVYLSTNYGPTMVVANSGKVGIGTNTPLGKLHVVESGNSSELIVEGIDPAIDFKHLGNNVGAISVTGQGGINLASFGGGDILITRNFIPQLRLQNNGKFLMGNFFQSFTQGPLIHYGLVLKKGLVIKTSQEFGDENEEWSIGIGCCRFLDPKGNVLEINRNGNFVANMDKDGDWTTASDRKLKTDVSDLESTLDGILKIRPVKYQYKNHLEYPETIGFIAQDIQPFFPEVVSSIVSKTGDQMLGIKYSKMAVIAIKAIQEQQELIEALQQQNKLLTERLEKLEKKWK